MTIVEAQAAVVTGARFSDVFELLEDDADRDALRAWFVRAPGVPRRPRRPAERNGHAKATRESGYTGDTCDACQGCRMRRNGACLLCEDCGSTSGCS